MVGRAEKLSAMANQYNTCSLCSGEMIRNGFNSSGRSRLRCKKCGTSTTATNDSAVQTARFKIFTDWILSSNSLTTIAADNKKSRRQITRWFETFWLVHVPNNIDPNRVFDQVFIDGTYFGHNNCLLVASSKTHVIAWRWCQRESTANYRRLLDQIPHPPLVATIDGHHGLLKALKDHWPTTKVQRCLVHIKRNIQQEVGLYPRHTTGKILRELSLSLLKVSTTEEAAQWSARLQEFSQLYGRYLNERTFIEDIQPADIPQRFRRNKKWFYTHYRHRSAWKNLTDRYEEQTLFTFLTSQDNARTVQLSRETNSLEGGVNAMVKDLARHHRGMTREHQRTAIDWWCYMHTQSPRPPHEIAKEQKWGRNVLAKVKAASTTNTANDLDGAPAQYDTGIESTHTNDIGIRKGKMH